MLMVSVGTAGGGGGTGAFVGVAIGDWADDWQNVLLQLWRKRSDNNKINCCIFGQRYCGLCCIRRRIYI